MIQLNELTKKRLEKFKKDRLAVASVFLLILLFAFSMSAELWANSRPILLYYQNHLYTPLLVTYHPSEFGVENQMITDYKGLRLGTNDWALWPPVRWDPIESNLSLEKFPAPPSVENIFGTDDRGRDVFARLLYGLRYTFLFAIFVWLISYLAGVVIGSMMGYLGGWVDLVGMRFLEVIQSTPVLFLLITIISIFTPNLFILTVFVAVFRWTGIALYMRAQFLALRKLEYVEAIRALGGGHLRIVFRHILPNGLTPIVTFSPYAIASGVGMLSILDYLGLGLQPPTPSWGELIAQAQKWFTVAHWLVLAPTLSLIITLTLLIYIGTAVRDAFDSKA